MKNDNDDGHYGYMRLTHILAVCLGGFPITRQKIINPIDKVRRSKHDGNSLVQGHRYAFDLRVVPTWLAYAALDALIVYYNCVHASQYVGHSFRKCFEESYCFAIIELANRNVGPMSSLACFMFYGYRHKVAALAGTERTKRFLGGHGFALPPTMATYFSAVVIVAYSVCITMYSMTIPAMTVVLYCFNAVGQIALYNLVVFQYYVLKRGYAHVNLLLETMTASRDPTTAHRALARLTRAHRDLGCLVDHLNRAYVPSMLIKGPYSIIRLVMIVFRIIELWAVVRVNHHPFRRVAIWLIVEHVSEILLFLLQLSCFSVVGHSLSYQAKRTLASLQKLKLCYVFQLDLEIRKMINIFRIQINARKVKASIGGYITINMNFFKAICGVIATYFLVLIQFKIQKGDSKPLHHNWD